MISQINSADTPDHEQNTPRGESIERGEAIEHPAANTGDTTTRRHASDSDTVLEEMTLRHLADSPPSADAEEEGVVATDTTSDGDIEGGTAQKIDMGDPDDFMNEKRHEVSATTSHHGRRNKKSGSKRRSKSKSKSKSHREDKTPQRDHSARMREKTKQTNAAIATSHIESRGSTSTTSHQNPSTEGKRGIDSLPSGDDDEAGAAIRIPDNRSFSSPADNDNNNDDNNNPSLCLLFDEEAQSNDDDDIAASSTHPSEGLDISENDYMDNTISDRALMNIIATDSGAVGAFHIDEPVPNIDDNMGTVEDRMRSTTTAMRREGLVSTRSMVSERRENMMNASARFLRIDSSDDESRRKLKRRMCMLTLLFVGTFAVVGGVTSGIRALMLDPPPDETIVIELNFDETSSGDGAEAEDESSSPATVTRPLTDFEIVTGMVDGRPLTNAEIAKGEVEMEAVDPYELFP